MVSRFGKNRAVYVGKMAALPEVPRLKLGSQGLDVSALGLGCMGMSAYYGPPKPEQEMIDLIHYAVALGVTFLDTADCYGPHTNEILVGKAIKGIREKVQLSTKFAITETDRKLVCKGDPEYVRFACEESLKRLDVDYIDLYYQHRVDKTVPIEITVATLKELVGEGKIKYIGLSEVSSSEIRRAHSVHPITAVQLEWSLWSRDVEEDIVPTCRELGIGIVPYSPLGRGFLSAGKSLLQTMGDQDYRKVSPRFEGTNAEHNEILFKRLSEIAAKMNATPGQLALAWVKHQGNDVAPIPGTTKIKNLEEIIASLGVQLSKTDLEEIGAAVPLGEVKGDRYHDMINTWQMTKTPPLSSWQAAA